MRDPKRLRAFELADQFALQIYKCPSTFPREEQFGLTSQLRRAAVSVASNIVEGCARSSDTDYVHFLDISYGSISEANYQVSLAHRLNYLSTDQFSSLESLGTETAKVLAGLIRSIRTKPRSPLNPNS